MFPWPNILLLPYLEEPMVRLLVFHKFFLFFFFDVSHSFFLILKPSPIIKQPHWRTREKISTLDLIPSPFTILFRLLTFTT